jgi:hypothetical protein
MVRSTDFEGETSVIAPPALPVTTLDYASPPPRGSSRRDTAWNIVIGILLANGVGWATFGLLMMNGYRDDDAGPVAVGLASVTLGLSLAVLRYFPRLAVTSRQMR